MKRYESDIQIPGLGTLIDVEFCARHVTLFGVKTGNSHAVGLIESVGVELDAAQQLETFEDAIYRVFGATFKEIGFVKKDAG